MSAWSQSPCMSHDRPMEGLGRDHLQDSLKAKVLALPQCELTSVRACEAPAPLWSPCNGVDTCPNLKSHALVCMQVHQAPLDYHAPFL